MYGVAEEWEVVAGEETAADGELVRHSPGRVTAGRGVVIVLVEGVTEVRVRSFREQFTNSLQLVQCYLINTAVILLLNLQ